jgi:hypothetical protein
MDDEQALGEIGGPGTDGVRQGGSQDGVDLEGDDRAHRGKECQGQRAEPRAHLDDDVVRPHARDPHDALDRVAVDDEVLPPLLGRADPEPVGELAHLRCPEQACGRLGHGVTLDAHKAVCRAPGWAHGIRRGREEAQPLQLHWPRPE